MYGTGLGTRISWGAVRTIPITKNIREVFVGKPYSGSAIGMTKEEFIANLKRHLPKGSVLVLDEDRFEIDLPDSFFTNPFKPIFKGSFQMTGTEVIAGGGFEYLIEYKISLLLLIGVVLILGLTSGSWILIWLVPLTVTWFIDLMVFLFNQFNRYRENEIKNVLDRMAAHTGGNNNPAIS
jgi:hypothetical protein